MQTRIASLKEGQSQTGLYTPAERARRDATVWTLVQGILAPIQLLTCVGSAILVLHWFRTGELLAWATGSVILKTALLYTIMVTGSIWEKVVFDKWLFAHAFFWEDVVSFVVIAMHTLYLVMLLGGYGSTETRLALALSAYVVYLVNATQFILKLKAARRQADAVMA